MPIYSYAHDVVSTAQIVHYVLSYSLQSESRSELQTRCLDVYLSSNVSRSQGVRVYIVSLLALFFDPISPDNSSVSMI
jgi:hypothetical protein